jgi:hypothetical protein
VDIAKALRTAAPDDKAEVYRELGINVRHEPGDRVIIAQAGGSDACSTERLGGANWPAAPRQTVLDLVARELPDDPPEPLGDLLD